MPENAFTERYAGTGPESYEKYFVPAIGLPLAHDLIEVADLHPGHRVLDVACGTGIVTRLAAERIGASGSVAGLDVNACMLDVARAAAPPDTKITWYETSAEAMPLPDASFDVVLCQLGLQFIPKRLAALREMRRVLAPDGHAVVSVPGPIPALFASLAEALAEHVHRDAADFVRVVFSLYDGGELRELFSAAGFDTVAVGRATKTLPLAAPADFLWGYVQSTPLSRLVAEAGEANRVALERDVTARWQDFVYGGRLTLEVDVTTIVARP